MDRRRFLLSSASGLVASRLRSVTGAVAAPLALPSACQLAWQRDELAMFLHFDVNTFTDREWGDGKEEPSIFAPTGDWNVLSPRQHGWLREAGSPAGAAGTARAPRDRRGSRVSMAGQP